MAKRTRFGQVRDNQRSKVYAAEDTVFSRHHTDFQTLDECRTFIEEVLMNTPHYAHFNGYRRIKLKNGSRNASWGFDTKTVALPPWARSKWVISHEMAHALKDKTHGPKGLSAAHGGVFCRHYIEIVRFVFHDSIALALELAFQDAGCQVMELKNMKP